MGDVCLEARCYAKPGSGVEQVVMEVLKDLYFNEKGFVFDPDSGAIYSLNTAGAFIVKQLQKGVPVNRVLGEMRKNFDVEEATARQDLRQFLDLLVTFGLLTEVPA